jgi:adenosylcobinamide-phosphate synthase
VLAVTVPAALVQRGTRAKPLLRFGLVAAMTWVVTGSRSLRKVAGQAGDTLESGDLPAAREILPSLCGRDPSALDGKEMARAVVESVAENTSDAVVAPLLWGAVAGLPGLAAYRAINTLDAMIGHHSPRYERFGWAAARLDDVANYIPARATAVLTVACAAVPAWVDCAIDFARAGQLRNRPAEGGVPAEGRRVPAGGGVSVAGGVSSGGEVSAGGRRAAEAWRAFRRYGGQHPSPNAGRCEAAFAGALGIRLGGTNLYHGVAETRPELGDGRPPEPTDIRRAVDLCRAVTIAAAALSAAVAVAVSRRHMRSLPPQAPPASPNSRPAANNAEHRSFADEMVAHSMLFYRVGLIYRASQLPRPLGTRRDCPSGTKGRISPKVRTRNRSAKTPAGARPRAGRPRRQPPPCRPPPGRAGRWPPPAPRPAPGPPTPARPAVPATRPAVPRPRPPAARLTRHNGQLTGGEGSGT